MEPKQITTPERLTDQQLLDLLRMIDANGDHKLSREEFGAAIVKRYAAQFPNVPDPLKELRADLTLIADKSPAVLAPGDTRVRAQDLANLDKENARNHAAQRLNDALGQAMLDPDAIVTRLTAIPNDMRADAAQAKAARKDDTSNADAKFNQRMGKAIELAEAAGNVTPEMRAMLALLQSDEPAVKRPETTVVHEDISKIGKQLLQYKPSDVNRDVNLNDIATAAANVPINGAKSR